MVCRAQQFLFGIEMINGGLHQKVHFAQLFQVQGIADAPEDQPLFRFGDGPFGQFPVEALLDPPQGILSPAPCENSITS